MQSRETSILAIAGNPLAAVLDREGRKPCVLNEVARGLSLLAQINKDRPVAATRLNEVAILLFKESRTELQSLATFARLLEYARICGDADYRAENLGGDAVVGVTVDHGLEPLTVSSILERVLPESVDQGIDVRENHLRPSIRSKSAAESSRFTPGKVPPVARETGSFTRLRAGRG